MTKQKTIGNNPLTAYLSNNIDIDDTNLENLNKNETIKKQRITLHISSDLIERIKNTVFWQPGLTLAAFCEVALEETINKIESERGSPFPQRKSPLKIGRPMKY